MDYQVRLDSFEGPLDLLLHLIRKHEIDIMNIPIALITEQYLQYIEMMKLLNLDLAGEYILMTATLMHIKSKMLLPPVDDEESDEDEEDPREELVRRLLEYKKYKEASQDLEAMDRLDRDNFLKGYIEEIDRAEGKEEDACHDVSLFDLLEALNDVLKSVRTFKSHEVELEKISVKEKMDGILDSLKKEGAITFQSLFDTSSTKGDVVATFLALLELIKTNAIRAFQGETFGTIRITSSGTIH
ncbi:MAG: segregation/condensation protein A [Deltaproteobacteria bacterium]|nr:segregation/condensation protein A [Deltaproteobacteria bacterium]